MTLTERIALMRRMLAQMRAIRARLNPLVLAQARRGAAAPSAQPALRAAALHCLAGRPDPQRPVPRRRK